jgi:hypothetical protein
MKFTKLSLVAALAVSSAFAGGDIAPVEPVVETPVVEAACNSNTTINGKAQLYYYTDDTVGLFDNASSALGAAVTLDVSHKIMDGITANFTAVGFTNLIDDNYMEGTIETDGFFNVANITATFADTTLVTGRQLLDTPMLGGFDWLLAPGSFEAYTLVNKSISNLTVVASYVAKWRPNNSGYQFIDLTDIGDGNNWTLGAAYSDAFDASVWYYNVDAGNYTQVYADAGTELSGVKLAAQFVNTDYDTAADSTVFGLKASGSVAGFDLLAAYNNIADNVAGYVGRDTLYASSWNTFTSNSVGNAFKFEAAKEFGGVSATASYAYYEYDQVNDEGHEIDVILAYGITNCISVDAIYSNTDYGIGDDTNALELIATYKF